MLRNATGKYTWMHAWGYTTFEFVEYHHGQQHNHINNSQGDINR